MPPFDPDRPHDYVRAHLLKGINFKERNIDPPEVLKHSQWDDDFEANMRSDFFRFGPAEPGECPQLDEMIVLMKNRFLMGAFRYTPLSEQLRVRGNYDNYGEIRRRLEKYVETGNTEYLVDAANFCLSHGKVGWYPPAHPGKPIAAYARVGAASARLHAGLDAAIEGWKHSKERECKRTLSYVAAMCAVEYAFGEHENKKFESIDDGIHMKGH